MSVNRTVNICIMDLNGSCGVMRPTPIALFVYNRFDEVEKTINALQKNSLAKKTRLLVFSDEGRSCVDKEKVKRVRDYVRSIAGFKEVVLVERDENFGLKKNIVDGVSRVVKQYGQVIVLEDDIVVSPHFLEYMNQALDLYEDDEAVCQVVGYSYFENCTIGNRLGETYFLRGADCLAWGTWQRSWKMYTDDSSMLLLKIKEQGLEKAFDRNGVYPFTEMLKNNETSQKSWAINWYAVNFLSNKYALYPLKSYALHIGAGENATNYKYRKNDPLTVGVTGGPIKLKRIKITEDPFVTACYERFLKKLIDPIWVRVMNKIISRARRLMSC